MQSVSSRIWTRIAVFISYGDDDYTTGTSYIDNSYAKFAPILKTQPFCHWWNVAQDQFSFS